ncbi:MAG TPA: phage/plasmid primase, P4 family [Gemmata sp.]
MCKVTPHEVIERFVMEYRAELEAEEAERKAKAEAAAREKVKAAPAKSSARTNRPRAGARDNRVERCRGYLKKIPPSVEGADGSGRMIQAARIIWNDFGIEEAEGLALLEEYNLSASPPWDAGGKQGYLRKWNEAVAMGPGPEGRGYRLNEDRPGWEPTRPPGARAVSTPGEALPTPGAGGDPAFAFPLPEDGEAWSDPYRLARLLVDRERTEGGDQTLLQWRDEFHQWDGAWRPFLDSDLDARVAAHCREVFVSDLPFRRQEEVLKAAEQEREPKPVLLFPVTSRVRTDARVNLAGQVNHPDSGTDAPFWLWGGEPHDPVEVIAAPNGLFTLRDIATARGPFEPPSPRFFTFNGLPFVVPDGEQDEPRLWMQCLRQWLNGDAPSILSLQEWFGCLLSADTSAHKILFLVGPPRSGKGTVLHVLTELVGAANVASTTFAALGENFGLEPLIGKRVAIIPDARLSGRTDVANVVERLLSISGEDAQTVNRKNRPRITTRLRARFVLASNEIPRLQDASGALASRFEILSFPNSFLGKEDRGLKQKLATELSAILAWAAKGFVRLRAQGMTFTRTNTAADYQRELEELSSPVKAFVRERCDVGPTSEVLVNDLFNSWKGWNEQRNREPGTQPVFGRDLHAAYPHVRTTQVRRGGPPVRLYRGIGLRPRDDWGEGPVSRDVTRDNPTHAWGDENMIGDEAA